MSKMAWATVTTKLALPLPNFVNMFAMVLRLRACTLGLGKLAVLEVLGPAL